MTAHDAPGTTGCDLGVVGWFDHWSFETQLRRVVVADELARRAPGRVRVFAPYGSTQPQPWTAGTVVEPLVPCTPSQRDALRAELGVLVAVGDARSVSPAAVAAAMPAHPLPSVEELEIVADWLAAPGIPIVGDVPDTGTDVHPGLLADRHWDTSVCTQRLEFLRAMQWWPQTGAPVVVAARTPESAGPESAGPESGIIEPGTTGPVVHLGPGARAFLDRLAPAADGRHAIDPALASLDDLVAAIAGAARVVTDDIAVAAVAAAHHRPVDYRRPGGAPVRSDAAIRALDDHFDAVVAAVGVPRTLTDERASTAARLAVAQYARAVAHERVVLADHVAALRNELAARTAERDALLTRTLRARAARVRRTIQSTRRGR